MLHRLLASLVFVVLDFVRGFVEVDQEFAG